MSGAGNAAAVVFGGSRGIGAATVAALAATGRPVFYTARQQMEPPPIREP